MSGTLMYCGMRRELKWRLGFSADIRLYFLTLEAIKGISTIRVRTILFISFSIAKRLILPWRLEHIEKPIHLIGSVFCAVKQLSPKANQEKVSVKETKTPLLIRLTKINRKTLEIADGKFSQKLTVKLKSLVAILFFFPPWYCRAKPPGQQNKK